MATDFLRRQVDELLAEAAQAIRSSDWSLVRRRAEDILALDPDSADAQGLLAAAERRSGPSGGGSAEGPRVAGEGEGMTSHPPATPSLPASFANGRYEIKRLLGEGGKKLVYLTHDSQLDRDVAFALLKSDGLDGDGLARLRREAQAMGRLGDHPHIVTVHDIGDANGQPYIVSQYMAGGSLQQAIEQAEDRRLSLEAALRIADEVSQALEHAHGLGVIHRDLKPGNVWLSGSSTLAPTGGEGRVRGKNARDQQSSGLGTAKLGDFGLAVALDRTRLTQAGMMVGTVAYMAPEQALGGEVTPRADLYSLGCMLYELITGRPPFLGDESVTVITQHLNTPPVSPSWHNPEVPAGLEALILRLLEKDPAKRPGSAAEVRQALASVGSHSPPIPAPPETREGVVYPPTRGTR